LLNRRALYALLRERRHFRFQAVAHEIEFVPIIFIGRVERGLSRGKGEDQPAMARIHGLEPENVTEKCAVGFSVLTVDDYVSARNHLLLQRDARKSWIRVRLEVVALRGLACEEFERRRQIRMGITI
jgi:hypothetical protein